MNTKIANRSEILFIYDIRDGNPNGDPLDENRPRMDEETGINLVTDVRLKRTIRDYLHDFKEQEIFVREIIADQKNGYIQDAKTRAKDFEESRTRILAECIDIRLFGGVIPTEKAVKKDSKSKTEKGGSITFTGPVQFKMGRSLHKVSMKHIRGTGAFASDKESTKTTFREEDILAYSLIQFYGIINENAAQNTGLTEEDVTLMLEGMWNGIKNMMTRTKVGQVPRLLLKINYSKKNYHIGDLDNMIKLVARVPDETIRDVVDYKLDISEFIKTLKVQKENIRDIELAANERLKFILDGADFKISDLAKETEIAVSTRE
jgi:CRISPR-associated protein Csh2